ncbi:hypothetical protein ACFX1Z_025599 [Malus domestica]
MIYQDPNPAPCSRLHKLLEQLEKHDEERKRSLEVEKVLCGLREMQKSFAYMLRIKAPVTLQEQWVDEDKARFNAWLNGDHFPYVFYYKSIPFGEWLVEKTGGQFSTPATNKIRPKKIVEMAEEKPRPPVFSVETEIMVGLEENFQVSEQKIDAETMPIDMIIGDKADMGKSHSAKLFELKAEIMFGGHNNCSTHAAAENEKYFTKSEIFGDDFLFGFGKCQSENFDVKRSQLGIKYRWPPPDYGSATFISI